MIFRVPIAPFASIASCCAAGRAEGSATPLAPLLGVAIIVFEMERRAPTFGGLRLALGVVHYLVPTQFLPRSVGLTV